jgi:hypothetical protein
MRSAIVCSRVWNVEGRGWTASPAILMSLSGCSHTPYKSWKQHANKDFFIHYILQNTGYLLLKDYYCIMVRRSTYPDNLESDADHSESTQWHNQVNQQ